MEKSTDLALSDIKVLDLTRAVAGPTCTRALAEMGAEVIKVESAPDGDFARGVCIFKNDRSLYYMQQNRGKKSVCINLKEPRGIEIVKELVASVDVVVENFKPGVLDALGLGYETLIAIKKDVILCSISTLGQTGPLAKLAGYDFIGQAYSGMTSMVGEPEQAPALIGAAIGDASTGIHGALGILAALRRRDRDGVGDHLDVSILDTYYSYHDGNVVTSSGSDRTQNPSREGSHYGYVCPAGIFRGNGGFVVIAAFMQHWPDFCRAIEREDLIENPDFCDDTARLARRDEVTAIIEKWLDSFDDTATPIQLLQDANVPCAPVLSVLETLDQPHLRARGTVRTVNDPVHGEVDIPGWPIRWKTHPNNIDLDAPVLGQHNAEILSQHLGKNESEIRELERQGILRKGTS